MAKIPIGAVLFVLLAARPSSSQGVEAVGSRALGMGGAFVAVANDSSATWWNPAALAEGPFFDMALGRAASGTSEALPVRRDKATAFTLGTPPFGFSHYRLRITDIRPFDPTVHGAAGREDRRAGVPVRSLSASHTGITVVQTLLPGVHAGATAKYLRGTLRTAREDGLLDPSDLLDRGDELEGGEAQSRFDADLGVIAVGGPVRAGLLIRNLLEPEFGAAESGDDNAPIRLPRQFRVGVAFDAARIGRAPLTVALDADLRRYETGTGERRVIAVGAEHWLRERRLAVRGGARINTVGEEDRAATAGVTVAVRAGLYLDGHIAGGGAADERGWGFAARVSF